MSTVRMARFAVGVVSVSTLVAVHLLGAASPATAVPAGAVDSSVSQGVSAKKPKPVAKPRLSFEVPAGPTSYEMYQSFTLRLTGNWKGPVTVTAYTDTFQAQVFRDVHDGQVVTVQMAPAGAGFACTAGTFEAEDASGQKAMTYFNVRYNT